jgi:hypothetical protein
MVSLGWQSDVRDFFSSQPTLLFPSFKNRVGHAKFQSCPLIY